MQTIELVVDALACQGNNNLAITLVSADGSALPAWQAGAHIDLHLAAGLIRQYSLTGNPQQRDSWLLCVKREEASRGGSRLVHEQLRPGQRLTASLPRLLFALQPAQHTVLMAGGIGITPLLAMAEQLDASGQSFELHYYVRQQADVAFRRRLQQGFRHGSVALWPGCEGHSPRRTLPTALQHPAGQRLYLCGPQGFMAHIQQHALQHGWSAERIHSEAFTAVQPLASAAEGEGFTLTLQGSGRSFYVPPEKSIAVVLLENDVAVPLSCEMGICGACLTPVIAGQADHRDTVQSAAEKACTAQQIALCCSRSRTPQLVIDL
ncbi:PDR/VanB family oxidoreductase [Erwinia amylovora]|uniref:Oxidoreductase n=4 Tax=Erwinia amylovora TaxID=552 RepID=A0ABX7MHR8_ERWAM|nr:PDR/VanB family oxidoreductase [Erwinia amylovora]CBX82453.1 putative vanillate O-demethylase oxidoreductase [Erwinia amylovora ATCC BAA-2158]CDK16847.1 putative vanillate O-demethylase oxidoreductase [Erwinia amylovora LA635]CDK20215.1 putative vanillate O-demethylase oxidoreductase [Erwinia amylovora LA636]CDK23586.1 putative vanillate O-demethylase oxidoreductase [Erwinia amylovora LA637]ATZ13063.1 oxidoreductase [Erwinia amylovora]